MLTQVEACLNSRPLVSLPCDDDGVEALTPGHFLIGRPMEALPDPLFSYVPYHSFTVGIYARLLSGSFGRGGLLNTYLV